MVEKTSKKVTGPDYIRIYRDLIEKKFPEKIHEYKVMLSNDNLSFFEIVRLNELLFGKKNKEKEFQEQRYKAYDKQTILKIIRYQRQNKLNDQEISVRFKLSRNTIRGWKKVFGSYQNGYSKYS